jgi:hypothetical protein
MRPRSYRPARPSLRLSRAAHDGQPALARVHALGAHREAALVGQIGEAEIA